MESVPVEVELAHGGERPLALARVGVMAGDGQIGCKERPRARQGVDPLEDAPHRGLLADAEARLALAADVAGVLEALEASVLDQRSHAEVGEAAGVEERRGVTGARQNFSQGWRPVARI